MINGKRIAVVLPAYNAEKTLETTVSELPDVVDTKILVDDHSSDRTVEIAERLGLQYYVHDQNFGIDNIRKFTDGGFECLLGVIGGQHHRNALAVDHGSPWGEIAGNVNDTVSLPPYKPDSQCAHAGLIPPIAGKLYVTHNLGGKVLVKGWGSGNAGVASHPGRYVQI